MYVTDLKKEFYQYLIGKHIVILVHHDIDALCTCRILQNLIKYDSIQYTLIPVSGIGDLKNAYQDNCQDINVFVLINCGGTLDLVEVLNPQENSIFFVLDSHKPTDVCNIYSDNQIKLLWQHEEDQNVPNFEDIFNEEDEHDDDDEENADGDDDDDEAGNAHSDEERAPKRRRLAEEDILRRRERRLWEERRNKLMFEYSQYTYYSKASAITLFDLAHQLAKDTKELLWLAILALSSQHLLAQIESSQYAILAGNLQLEVERLNRRQNNPGGGGGGGGSRSGSSDGAVGASMQISVERELKLSLYRHWSVDKSIACSLYTMCKMKLWSIKGERRLQELLADMGLPLAQSRQRFSAMALTYRNEFAEQLEKCGTKFGLDDLSYPSFMVKYGYRFRYSAADMVYILIAILEQSCRSKEVELCFSEALDCLAKPPPPALLTRGLDRAKVTLEACQKILKSALDQKKIYSIGPFLYFVLHESNGDCQLFGKAHTLLLLGRYIQQAYCERRPSANAMPLLIAAPILVLLSSNNGAGGSSTGAGAGAGAGTLQSSQNNDHHSQNSTQQSSTMSSMDENSLNLIGSGSGSTNSSQNVDRRNQQQDERMYLLLGLPPLCENSPKSFFGKAFEQVAEKCNAIYSVDYFDTSFIKLRGADQTRFFDSLANLLS